MTALHRIGAFIWAKTMTRADAIRQVVETQCIKPARASGKKQVTVRAGHVHIAMKLKDRMPAVASSLGAKYLKPFTESGASRELVPTTERP
jgi:hypothetical protein